MDGYASTQFSARDITGAQDRQARIGDKLRLRGSGHFSAGESWGFVSGPASA
jgi:hypothetical protein